MGKAVDGAVSVAGEVLRVAKENPDARTAGQNLARSFRTVTETINVALLPLAMINYGAKRAKEYFENKFPDEIGELLATIPDGQLVEPKASVAGPALQGLAFSHDEKELKDLYLELLASAMNSETADDVHPAYAEIIRQLSAREVHLLEGALKVGHAIAEITQKTEGEGGHKSLMRPVVSLSDDETRQVVRQGRFPESATNWYRLGLVDISYTSWHSDAREYDFVKEMPEYAEFEAMLKDGQSLSFTKGAMQPTPFGVAFARAVGILPSENTQNGAGSPEQR